MCFSAQASFATAALLAGLGAACIGRTSSARELPLASLPLLFAAQQAVEGALWLALPGANPALTEGLTLGFLGFAKALWPIYAPLAVLLCEPRTQRRRLVAGFVVAGGLLSTYLLAGLISYPQSATLQNGHIRYATDQAIPFWTFLVYVGVTCIPFLVSSHRAVRLFGTIVLAGGLAGAARYAYEFVSVWCFFAAAASAVLLLHFEGRQSPGRSALLGSRQAPPVSADV